MSSLVAVVTSFLWCDHYFCDRRRHGLFLRGVGADAGTDLVVGTVMVVGCRCRSPRGRRLGGSYLGGRRRFLGPGGGGWEVG